jgi:DNA mismatch repair protein MutS
MDVDIPMCGIPHHALEIYLQRLIKKGILAAVCDQIESPAVAKQHRRVIKREITRIVTPGTISEENLLEAREFNYICCISKDLKENFGIAWLDMSTGDFLFCKSTCMFKKKS